MNLGDYYVTVGFDVFAGANFGNPKEWFGVVVSKLVLEASGLSMV